MRVRSCTRGRGQIFSALQQVWAAQTQRRRRGPRRPSSSTAISRHAVAQCFRTRHRQCEHVRRSQRALFTCSPGFRCLATFRSLLSPDGNCLHYRSQSCARPPSTVRLRTGCGAQGAMLLRQWDRAMPLRSLPRPRPARLGNRSRNHARRRAYRVNFAQSCSTVKAATVLRTVFPQRRAVRRIPWRERRNGGHWR